MVDVTIVNCAKCGKKIDISEDAYLELRIHKNECNKPKKKRMIIT